MRRLLLALPLLLLAPLAAPLASARAEDEAKTYDLHTWNPVWKVGSAATFHSRDALEAVFDISAPNPQTGEVQTEKRAVEQLEVFTYVSRCLAADDAGVPTKSLVYVKEWTHTETEKQGEKETAKEPDTSLKGLHVEVTVADGKASYKVLTPDAKPSEDGVKWLDKKFGPKRKGSGKEGLDLDQMGRPEGPVKVGDAWKGDPLMLDFPMPLDAEQSKVALTLAAVADGAMQIKADVSLKLQAFPLGEDGPKAPFTDGGMLEGQGDMKESMAPGTFDSEGTFEATLKGTASIKGAVTIVLEMNFHTVGGSKTGGEMPAAPAAAPGAKPEPAAPVPAR